MKKLITILLFFTLNISWGQIIWQRCDEGGVPDCDGSTIPAKGRHDLQPQAPFLTVQELVDNFGILMRPAPGFGFVEFTGWWFSDSELGIYYLNNGGGLWSMGHDCGGALPITLVSFSGEIVEGINFVVELNWRVASQVNNDYYEIQRSKNLNIWSVIDSIPGSGTTNIEMDYSIIDDNPFEGVSYYRLKQTDHNGKTETFSPIAITIESEDKVVSKIINLMGQEVPEDYQGIVIEMYTDGTYKKKYK